MQTIFFNLNGAQLTSLQDSLLTWKSERGSIILGSQLGQLIGSIIHPATLKDYGGLRRLVERDLPDLAVLQPFVDSTDSRYLICVDANSFSQPSNSLANPSVKIERVIEGIELWRQFSNPRLTTQLAASPSGEIVVAPIGFELSSGKFRIKKPDNEAYRHLGISFVKESIDHNDQEHLLSILNQDDFYNNFISALRGLRSSERNTLKEWEIFKSQKVAENLHNQLVAIGIDAGRASEITLNASPTNSKTISKTIYAHKNPEPIAKQNLISKISDGDETEILRKLVRNSIDHLTAAELKGIQIPAGVFLKVLKSLSN